MHESRIRVAIAILAVPVIAGLLLSRTGTPRQGSPNG
jgi:hypothetical protein